MQTGAHDPLPGMEQRVEVCRKHLHFAMRWKGDKLGLLEMRPHYANYLKGFPNIKEYRTELVHANSLEEIEAIFERLILAYTEKDIALNEVNL